jgi:hypothetical protein
MDPLVRLFKLVISPLQQPQPKRKISAAPRVAGFCNLTRLFGFFAASDFSLHIARAAALHTDKRD